MTEETAIIERIRRLPQQKQEEVLDFIAFIENRLYSDALETMLASEPILKREWETPEEDAAWALL